MLARKYLREYSREIIRPGVSCLRVRGGARDFVGNRKGWLVQRMDAWRRKVNLPRFPSFGASSHSVRGIYPTTSSFVECVLGVSVVFCFRSTSAKTIHGEIGGSAVPALRVSAGSCRQGVRRSILCCLAAATALGDLGARHMLLRAADLTV